MVIPIFEQFDRFLLWARTRARALAMEVQECDLCELEPDWTTSSMAVTRLDGRFFQVHGVNVTRAAGREVSGWKQPMLCLDGGGYVALITLDSHNPATESRMLVRMKAEPGNRGMWVPGEKAPMNTHVLVAPPAQFSQGNLENHRRALRGELDPNGVPYGPVPFASLALEDACPTWASTVTWHEAVEDGGRFYLKTNRYGVAEVDERMEEQLEEEIKATGQSEHFAWISRGVLRGIFRHPLDNCLASGHLRSVASLLV